jgi:hypothetical protein
MPKVTLSTIGSRYGSIDALNANFASIEAAIENTLSRDGEVPNAMQSDLNMDGNRIINAVLVSAQDFQLDGLSLADAIQEALDAAFAADASADAAALSATAAAADALTVLNAKLIWRGMWDAGTTYAINDAVEDGGTSYIATAPSTNEQPPNASFWDVLALRGQDGASGTGSGDVSSVDSVSVDNEIALFSGTSGKLIKRAVSTGLLKATSGVLATAVADTDYLAPAAIGVTVQGYDVDTAKTDVAQTFTASQRGTVTTDNDLSFDLSATNNFSCTPTGAGTLTFTNLVAGQSGFILLDNSGAHAISAAATTKLGSSTLAAISVAGIYLLSYFSNGTNVYVVASGALA